MLSAIHSFFFGAKPVEFESEFGLSESIARLERATKRSAFAALTSQEAVGTVSETKVLLQRVIPFVGNSFKPYFVGRFEQRATGVVLIGRFTMHWTVKVLNTVWFGFCVFWTVLATVKVASSSPDKWYFLLFGVGMLFAGTLLLHVGKWFARNDPAWLSQVIEAALRGTSAA